jgi:hypothetical protein
MPNHTTNRLKIEGNGVDKFVEDARGQGENKDINDKYAPLDFESLYPTPPEMRGEIYRQTEDGEWKAPAWYEWRIENWGTKWNCYDHHGDWNDSEITFFTAWSPPSAFFLHVSKSYPDVTFKLEFADEGAGFLGSETIKDGELDTETAYAWDSDEGKALREKLGVYFPEDEEEYETEEA